LAITKAFNNTAWLKTKLIVDKGSEVIQQLQPKKYKQQGTWKFKITAGDKLVFHIQEKQNPEWINEN